MSLIWTGRASSACTCWTTQRMHAPWHGPLGFITSSRRPHLKEAGNLRYVRAHDVPNCITILDADFCPPRLPALEVIPCPHRAVSSRSCRRHSSSRCVPGRSGLSAERASFKELFYRAVQVNQDRFGRPICAYGDLWVTTGLTALEPFGAPLRSTTLRTYTGFPRARRGLASVHPCVPRASGVC
jgi:hypothetical protein